MSKHRPSFFERLTGAIRIDDVEEDFLEEESSVRRTQVGDQDNSHHKEERHLKPTHVEDDQEDSLEEISEEVGELSIDMHETDKEIVIKSIVAGVRPDDLDISITREMVVISGKREGDRTIQKDNFFHQELYWGSFSRTILLPQEIDTDSVEAVEKHGLLIIKLPKLNKNIKTKVRVKSH